jgi:C4-dicarboxylate transporter DctQ subunit
VIASAASRLEEGLMAFLLAAMSILSFVQVILRYFFAIGMPWALEVITYMFAWMVLLGMSYCVKTGSHLGIDLAVKALPARGYRIAGVIGALACLIYSAILLYGSWNYVSRMYGLGVEAEDIPVQKWVILSALPIGFALLFFRFGQVLVGIVKGDRLGLGLADEVKDNLDLFKDDDLTANPLDRR